jgi:transcriptional regulator with XRE-family HTH domain
MSEVEFISIFADNLRDLMESQGLSQRELSRESDVSHVAISMYLKKQRMPSVKSLINLSLALDCNLDDLIPFYDFIH